MAKMYGSYKTETYGDGTRRCVFCGEIKSLKKDFPRNGTDRNGKQVYRYDCKRCYNIRRKEDRNKKAHSDFVGGQKRRGEDNPEFSHQDWKNCLIYFGGCCAYCGSTPRRNKKMTKDHLKPISKGGLTSPDNIIPACFSCNSSKGAEDFKEWFMKQPYFSQDRLNTIFKWRAIMRQVND